MQIDENEFQALITYYMKKRGIKGLNELSESTLISYKTLLKYWKDPERFPLGEVVRIMDALKIPSEEFLLKIFKKKSGGSRSEAEEEFKSSTNCRSRGGISGSSNHNRRSVIDIGSVRSADELSKIRI